MKKLLGTTLALAMLVPAGANAELLKNLKIGGNLDIQTTSARNVIDFVTRPTPIGGIPDNNDRISAANTRLMLKADWDLLDDVHSRVTFVKGDRVYGSGSQDLNTVQSAVFVEEASVKIDKLFGLLDVTAGRQFYGEEGDLIAYFGPRDNYGLTVSAIDAFRADWNGEHMTVTLLAGRTADAGLVNGLAPNVSGAFGTTAKVDLRGIVVSVKMNEMIKPTAYIYNRVTHATGGLGSTTGKNDNLYVAGLKAKITASGLTANVELAKNFGEDRSAATKNNNYKGWAFQTKLGYKAEIDGAGSLNPWGEFGYGTGDSNFDYAGNATFQSIATDYRPGGIYGRFDANAAVAVGGGALGASDGLSNRIIWGLGVNVTPSALNKLTVGAGFYRYAFARLPNNSDGTKLIAQRDSRNIGSEVDATATWKHSENVSFKATAGSFKPGAFVADQSGPHAALNPAVMLAGDVSIKF